LSEERNVELGNDNCKELEKYPLPAGGLWCTWSLSSHVTISCM